MSERVTEEEKKLLSEWCKKRLGVTYASGAVLKCDFHLGWPRYLVCGREEQPGAPPRYFEIWVNEDGVAQHREYSNPLHIPYDSRGAALRWKSTETG